MSLPPTSGLIIEFKGKGELLSNAHGTTIVPFTCSECVLSLVPICKWEPWEVMIWSLAVPGALRKTLAWESFFFFLIAHFFPFFYWRKIALQYFVGLYHTSTWISHRYTYVPSLLNPPSPSSNPSHFSKLSQNSELSSLYYTANTHLLSIFTYGNVLVSMLFSQFVPPFPSPSVHNVFSMSVSPLLLCK